MPRVPEVRSQQVQESGLNVGGGFSTASFGGTRPLEAIADATQNLLSGAIKIAAAEKDKADRTRVLAASQELSKYQDELLWNQQSGYYTKQGKDAAEGSTKVMEDFDGRIKEIEKGLSNNSQISQFRDVAFRWSSSLNRGVQRHGFRESQKAHQALIESSITNEKNNAIQNYGDPQSVAESLRAIEDNVTVMAKTAGLPNEWLQTRLGADRSEVHTRIVQQMINDHNYTGAAAHYENNKDFFVGQDAVNTKKYIQDASVRGQSQEISDSILETNKFLSLSEALKEARQIDNPDLRDAVTARIQHRFAENDNSIKQQKELFFNIAEDFVRNKKEIPVDIYSGLDSQQRIVLEKYANPDPSHNHRRWLDFNFLPTNSIAQMSQSEFTKYYVDFDNSHRDKALSLRKSAQDSLKNGSHSAQYAATLTFKDMMKSTFENSGLVQAKKKFSDYNDDEVVMFNNLSEIAQEKVIQYSDAYGKKPTPVEIQKMVDDVILNQVSVKKGFFSSRKNVPTLLIQEKDKDSVKVDIDNIPDDSKADITNYLKSRGKYVSTSKIERIYGAMKLQDRDLVEKILGE